ncbi:MAG: hypothetical protein A2092_18860 [Rhodobacteraceae bacterium GWE1_64_9]|nr:MAG: hypothetical protein A2092_18860 [Rhodobacteraceae bacterium GWE1_64_9]OHC50328.1 MAG: hypothetical protein A2X69_16795 [Rhodobacteraceae bacterium GWF1_65_7]HBD92119.1 hypothetical protein [Gemmobacter sp.]
MGRRATFTEAQITRAMKAARRIDPGAVVEVTREGVIRILPASAETAIQKTPSQDPVEMWFNDQD